MEKYTIRLNNIDFTYHIDKGGGRFAQSLAMEVSIDVLTDEQQQQVKQAIFDILTKDKKDCVLL